MNFRIDWKYTILSILFALNCSSGVSQSLKALRVNHMKEPLGIEAEKPVFSWRMETINFERGVAQVAYQILVWGEDGNEVWDSKKIESGISINIPYNGKSLSPKSVYEWTVKVWDNKGRELEGTSRFETSLMDYGMNAWNDAQWIGGGDEDISLYSHYLSVFRVDFGIQLDSKTESTRASFVFGANDRRLMDANKNLLGMQVGKDEAFIALELDISPLGQGNPARVNIFRNGYTPEDKSNPLIRSFEISKDLINSNNKYDSHYFEIASVQGVIDVFLMSHGEFQKLNVPADGTPSWVSSGINLNPYGEGSDFICFPMLADIGFQCKKGQKATFTDVEVKHFRTPSNTLFSMASSLILDGTKEQKLMTMDPSANGAPMLRTEFTSENKKVKKARLYSTARGIYELYMNGEKVNDDYFSPGLTQYNKHHMYQIYDVTELIEENNANAIGVYMSEGWWSGHITFRGEHWNYFGDRQSFLGMLEIEYEDGSMQIITSNNKDWKISTGGPIRYGSFFQGEVYDARMENKFSGWNTPGYNDEDWKRCEIVSLEGTAAIGDFINFARRPFPLYYDEMRLMAEQGPKVKNIFNLTAQSVTEVRPGVFVYDMGQNMVGAAKISLKNTTRGDSIFLRYAEVLYPDLPEYKQHSGMIMMENIRAAYTQDLYICKGAEEEIIDPRFTFHGYRFVEITGIEEALSLDQVEGKVLSSIYELSSEYKTSNALINRFWENITWSLRANFLSIPTDTPARNERMGWNGDINVFSRASTWLADVYLFLDKHLMAMRDLQNPAGRYTDVAPVGNGFGGTLWGSAGIVIPWELYQQYGDTQVLEDHYESMKNYVDFLETQQNKDDILLEGPLGDWLSPENSKNDNTALWTAYQIYDLHILSEVARILGKTQDAFYYNYKYLSRKSFFNQKYFDPETGKTIHSGYVGGFGPAEYKPEMEGKLVDTQASYAIALAMGAVSPDKEQKVAEHLATAVKRKNTDDSGVVRPEYSLMTGFIGTAAIGQALSDYGYDDLIYKMLENESYPSWLYPVVNGATTIWERLNSYTHEDGFGGNNSMNSFNHYSFGAVGAWMYNYSLGIKRDPENPGFKTFLLEPTPDPNKKLTFANGYYESPYGKIGSEWQYDDNGIKYEFTIPANTTAIVSLIADDIEDVTERGTPISNIKDIQNLMEKDGKIHFELGSGHYIFIVKE